MGTFDGIAQSATDVKLLTDKKIKTYIDLVVFSSNDISTDPSVIEIFFEGLMVPNHITGS